MLSKIVSIVLFLLCVALDVFCASLLSRFWSASWIILLLILAWTIGLGIWSWKGLKNIKIGSKGQLLFLAQRIDVVFDEGWCWVPFPFGIEPVECKEITQKLDQLTVIACHNGDNVQVFIDGTIFYKVVSPGKYLSVKAEGIKEGMDSVWDETIRTYASGKSLDEVLQMRAILKQQTREALAEQANNRWGIEILDLVIAGIKPDPEVMKNLELKRNEESKREGDKVKVKNFIDRVNELMEAPPNGSGLTREQAVEQAQLSMGLAVKNIDAKTLGLDPVTAEALAKILETFGRK